MEAASPPFATSAEVAAVVNALTARIELHQRELSDHDDDIALLRSDFSRGIALLDKTLAAQSVMLENQQKTLNRVLGATITVATMIVGAAALVLSQGVPTAP